MNLKYAEFYITNVCNLNCTNCNRFNNFAFAGHQSWNDYKDSYTQWADKLSIDWIAVLGGEPMLAPDFMDWVVGITKLWPSSKFSIVTNGTQLNRHDALYAVMLENKHRMFLEVSMHGPSLKELITKNVTQFLKGNITKHYSSKFIAKEQWQSSWNAIKGDNWPDCPTADDFDTMPDYIKHECLTNYELGPCQWQDENGVQVIVSPNDRFFDSSVIFNNATGTISLQNSDPELANKVCYSKYCHHFIRGKLHKCGVVGILPEFVDQFETGISESNRDLLMSYKPADHTWNHADLAKFLQGLESGETIEQCKFCPSEITPKSFDAGTKKIKIFRKVVKIQH